MALAGREVQYAQEGNVKLGRIIDTVVDPDTGVAAQRERTMIAVPTEDGGAAIVVGERFKAVQMVRITMHCMYMYLHDMYRY